MKKLTEKQQSFVTNKAYGMRNKEAAISAGFSAKSADVQAATLLARADIKDAIKAAKKAIRAGGEKVPVDGDEADKKVMKDKYPDSLSFMVDAMNNPKLPPGVRFDAAKQLLPYQHARLGEKGKKESAKDRANEIAGTGKKVNKYAPKSAPKLHVVR
jgi:phage terminase small subunit